MKCRNHTVGAELHDNVGEENYVNVAENEKCQSPQVLEFCCALNWKSNNMETCHFWTCHPLLPLVFKYGRHDKLESDLK